MHGDMQGGKPVLNLGVAAAAHVIAEVRQQAGLEAQAGGGALRYLALDGGHHDVHLAARLLHVGAAASRYRPLKAHRVEDRGRARDKTPQWQCLGVLPMGVGRAVVAGSIAGRTQVTGMIGLKHETSHTLTGGLCVTRTKRAR